MGCFSHDHKLDLKIVKQTLTGQRYIDEIHEPIVYPHFQAHQAARPIFQDYNADCPSTYDVYRARIVTDSLAQEGIDTLVNVKAPVVATMIWWWLTSALVLA